MKTRNFLSIVVMTVSLGLSVLACGSSGGSATKAPSGKDISGTYTVTGVNLDGNDYSGEVTLTSLGSDNYAMAWTIGNGNQKGTGNLSGDTLKADWSDGSNIGAVTYTMQADGSFSGTWTQEGVSGTGTETLTPKK